MSFKLYRPKGTIQAQVVEADMVIGDIPDGASVKKGDYMTLVDGRAKFVPKDEFEKEYEPVRQKKNKALEGSTSKAKDKKKTQAAGETK